MNVDFMCTKKSNNVVVHLCHASFLKYRNKNEDMPPSSLSQSQNDPILQFPY